MTSESLSLLRREGVGNAAHASQMGVNRAPIRGNSSRGLLAASRQKSRSFARVLTRRPQWGKSLVVESMPTRAPGLGLPAVDPAPTTLAHLSITIDARS